MQHPLNIALSTLSSTLRLWQGTSSSKKSPVANKDLILFDREGDPECRIVREALTALNLDALIMPCPLNGRNIRQLKRESGSSRLPRLYDSNTETNMVGITAILQHLYLEYHASGQVPAPSTRAYNLGLSRLASMVRFQSGCKARSARLAEQPLTLYSFESSPYSRPVRELLCELELPYHLINLGKQQWPDMGPAKARFTLKPYQPLPGSKREAFFRQHGNVQVPYLVDPNTGARLFESEKILAYLKTNYLV
ncbi:MAG: hypothetical protein C9356_09935 [Oleiphilus sp.]|nr:MAG: hypothetical protein C9356_09935 [Oleiphilus sp.]